MIEIVGYPCLSLSYQYSNKYTSINFYKKKNLVCYLSKILACGLVTECRLGILDGMKSEERVYFHMGAEILFNC